MVVKSSWLMMLDHLLNIYTWLLPPPPSTTSHLFNRVKCFLFQLEARHPLSGLVVDRKWIKKCVYYSSGVEFSVHACKGKPASFVLHLEWARLSSYQKLFSSQYGESVLYIERSFCFNLNSKVNSCIFWGNLYSVSQNLPYYYCSAYF